MDRALRWLCRPAAACLSGLLLALSMPPTALWPLAWFALVPVLLAVRGQRFFVAFLLGGLAAYSLAVCDLSGRLPGYLRFEGDREWISTGCAFFGAIVGLVSALFAEVRSRDRWAILALAASAVLFEAVTLLKLPVTFALSQSGVLPMRLAASLTGIWGVSFLLWAANLGLADALSRLRLGERSELRDAARGLARPVLGAAGLTLLALIWRAAYRSDRSASVVLVQSDATETPRLTTLSGKDPNSLAVWPECSGMVAIPAGRSEKFRQLTNRDEMPAIVTDFRDAYQPLPHNTAALFWRGAESAHYEKRLLFGTESSIHSPGDHPVAVPWQGTQVGLNICFDSCSPELIRDTGRLPGVGLIALPTIDPPAPNAWMAAMHAAFTSFRAAEEGVSIARADGYAYSEAADPTGQVLALMPPGEGSKTVRVPLARRWTLYGWLGDYFLIGCGLLVAGWCAYRRRRLRVHDGPTAELDASALARNADKVPRYSR